jgi:hypothetical protein
LAAQTDAWKKKEATKINKPYNMQLKERLDYVYGIFHVLAPD